MIPGFLIRTVGPRRLVQISRYIRHIKQDFLDILHVVSLQKIGQTVHSKEAPERLTKGEINERDYFLKYIWEIRSIDRSRERCLNALDVQY